LPEQSEIAAAASKMPARLADWGYGVSTGPLVWNRFKEQLRSKSGRNVYPLIWAEAVTADGRFVYRAERRGHAPYFHAGKRDEWLIVRQPAVLVQRTTAKEQPRRLIAAELPASFLAEHGAVVVENHLNMVRARVAPKVSPAAVAAVLNSAVVDQVFRCISGSVAVSAFELEAIPLPSAKAMAAVEKLVSCGASRQAVEEALTKLYGLATA
jgi:adenine-specific DNA-methyltransferase